jgi:fucose 4-O-acetylase-like acetyltransferase
MTSPSRSHQEIARGFLLLGVFHVHALYTVDYVVGGPESAPMAWLQIKLLSPVVAVFFVLAGMGSRQLATRPTRTVLARSLMLWFLAVASHLLGVVLSHLVYEEWVSWRAFAKALVKPILYGTGHASFVPWFFTVLALVRVLVHLLGRRPLVFLPVVLGLVASLLVARAMGLPDNLHEWRNWPAAFGLFLAGMWIPTTWKVPHWAAPASFAAWLAISLINSPTLLTHGPAWNREPTFVADPKIGSMGFAPLFFLQIACALVFLLWLGRTAFGSLPGKILRYFGSRSLQILFLHGAVLVSIYPLASRILPKQESLVLFLILLAVNPALHALLYTVTQRPIRWLLAACGGLASAILGLFTRKSAGNAADE